MLNSEAPPVHGQLKPGESVVYVIDCSASMGLDGMLGSAVASLKASLARLGPDVRFQIVAYNGGTSTFGTELLPARAETISGAGRWLDKLVAEGRSDHRAGMREALWFRPDHVYLLTDADDLTEGDARAVRALIHTPVQMSAAIFGGLRTKWVSPLERLVGDFSGTVQYMRR